MNLSEIAQQVRLLSRTEQEMLINQVVENLAQSTPRSHSILELRGLGKEIWQGIDAQNYIDELRNEWDLEIL